MYILYRQSLAYFCCLVSLFFSLYCCFFCFKWKTNGDVTECASDDVISDDAYEPGQAVGVGIKAEMWKTKHPNLTILETVEDTPVLVGFYDSTSMFLFFSLENERASDRE